MSNGKSLSSLLSTVQYDKDDAFEKGVGIIRDGNCVIVKRATVLMYQTALTIFQMNEVAYRAYWQESDDPFPVLYREAIALEWPLLSRNSVKGDGNRLARGRCFGIVRGSQPRPYCYVPQAYRAFIQHIVTSAAAKFPQFHLRLCRSISG